jgi:glutamate synthase (NADPH/NADH) large chain
VVVLGRTGRNFAAGMSGGVAYVYDPERQFAENCNMSMVELEPMLSSAEQKDKVGIEGWHSSSRDLTRETDEVILKRLIENHFRYTGSFRARDILGNWQSARGYFVKVMPTEYRRALGELWDKANPATKAA